IRKQFRRYMEEKQKGHRPGLSVFPVSTTIQYFHRSKFKFLRLSSMKSFTLPTLIYFIVLLNGCKKMDVRPHSSIVLPATVSDFERLLENDMVTSTPALTHLGGDEYILKDYDTWLSLYTNTQRNAY